MRCEVLFSIGSAKVLRCSGPLSCKPVVIIPSLINSCSIFFLNNGGLVGSLVERGFVVYLISFDSPLYTERLFFLEDYVTNRIYPILMIISDFYKSSVPLIGYCMGGIFSLCCGLQASDRVKSLCLIAVPWKFETPRFNEKEYFCLLKMIEGMDIIPAEFISHFFSFSNLDQIFCKYDKLLTRPQDEKLFWDVEDWCHRGISMTKNVAIDILSWIQHNHLSKKKFLIDGEIINPSNLEMPALFVISKEDKITTPNSALNLVRQVRNSSLIFSQKGHIGLFVEKDKFTINFVCNWLSS